jgi:ATP-binding cassette subfamily B protein
MFLALAEDRTLLVITHRPVMLDRFDQVAVLENGTVAEIGTAAALFAAGGRYAALTRRLL